MQPHCVGLSSATAEGPFTSISTDRIFPFWLDFILKAMEVSSHNQLAWVMDIVIKAPEVLDGGEGVDGADGASPGCLLGLSLRVVEPEGPGVLERVRRGGVGLRRRVAGVVVGDLPLLPLVSVVGPAAAGRRRPSGGRRPDRKSVV